MRKYLTTSSILLCTAAIPSAQIPAQVLSKEYIRAGGRTLAVESYLDLNLTLATNVTQSNRRDSWRRHT